MILDLDLETYSTIPITTGVHKYAEGSEILIISYSVNDEPVTVLDLTAGDDDQDFRLVLAMADELWAQNSQFDRVMLEYHGYIEPRDPRWQDTMVRAYAHGLPGSLGEMSDLYQLGDKGKDKDGRQMVLLFCKPKSDGSRATRETHPEQWKKLLSYAGQDIVAMQELRRRLPKWNDEHDLWLLDQKINDRGFLVDVDLAKAAVQAVRLEKKDRNAAMDEATGGDVQTASQRDALLAHIKETFGITFPDLRKSTVERRLNDPDLPEPVKDLLRMRLVGAATSASKYETLLECVNEDGRFRGGLQFCGAPRTGRWAGRRFQPQNLPRPTHSLDEINLGIEALKAGCADLLFDSVTGIASSAIRGCVIAPPGKKLVVADLSSIEGRGLAWLASEQYKLDAYCEYDAGRGYDMYVLTFARTFNRDPATVTKPERQLGKVLELAMGYGGGVGAFVTFANGYGIDLAALADSIWDALPELERSQAEEFWNSPKKRAHGLSRKTFVACDTIKRLWRKANPKTTQFWWDLEDAVKMVLAGYGPQRVGERIVVDKIKNWLRIRLPSGRYLCYAGAHLVDGGIVYRGNNQYTKKWGDIRTYGGKLAENVTQAVSRDILAHGMQLAEANHYGVVLSVHDELITEAPDRPRWSVADLSRIMSVNPPWAEGLPLAADGFEDVRYHK